MSVFLVSPSGKLRQAWLTHFDRRVCLCFVWYTSQNQQKLSQISGHYQIPSDRLRWRLPRAGSRPLSCIEVWWKYLLESLVRVLYIRYDILLWLLVVPHIFLVRSI